MRPLQASYSTALFPEDLDTLQRVFDRLCDEYQWPRDSAHAQRHGRMLIQAYQAGTTDERLLLMLGRWFVNRSRKDRRPA